MMPKKLKHIALEEIHYQLLNICLIISSIGWRYCQCHRYEGCRQRPSHHNLLGERNYCCICQIKKTYNMDYLYNLTNIQETWENYIGLKKDLQHFLVTSRYQNFWHYHYSLRFCSKKVKSKKDMLLKNYIKQSYIQICILDP